MGVDYKIKNYHLLHLVHKLLSTKNITRARQKTEGDELGGDISQFTKER
jgi:hypothetical protein